MDWIVYWPTARAWKAIRGVGMMTQFKMCAFRHYSTLASSFSPNLFCLAAKRIAAFMAGEIGFSHGDKGFIFRQRF
jgi:hypothetical protein